MKKIKLRDLSPFIVSIFILSTSIIGIVGAVATTQNGSIGGLFNVKDSIGWDYNLLKETTRGYRLDAKNIFPANFGSNDITTAGKGTFNTLVSGTGTFIGDLNGTNDLLIMGNGDISGTGSIGSLVVGGNKVINSNGKWVGSIAGLQGVQGVKGATGTTGDTGNTGDTLLLVTSFLCNTGEYLVGIDLVNGTSTCNKLHVNTTPPVLSSTTKTFTTTQGTPLILVTVTAIDAVDGTISVIKGGTTPDFNVTGTYKVTYSATDAAGNTSTITHTYKVNAFSDTVAPVLSSTTKTFTRTQGAPLTLVTVTATDAVDGTVSVTKGGTTPDFNVIGTYKVTYSATDAAGNTSTITHTYQVKGKRTALNCGTRSGQIIYGTSDGTDVGLTCSDDIIVCNGTLGNGITISACNLGTNIVGIMSSSYGGHFQFGRNIAYPTGWINGTFTGSANDWGVQEANKTTATYTNVSAANKVKMQGPCATGYHVPTSAEWVGIHTAGGWGTIGTTTGTDMMNALKISMGGIRSWVNDRLYHQNITGYYWSSSPNGTNAYNMDVSPSIIDISYYVNRANGLSVRCFKN